MTVDRSALAGKVAVVTGGGTGIGAGICLSLAEAGANVVVSPHSNVVGAEQCAERIRQVGSEALVVACDVRDENQVTALFDATIERFGRVDALVNNAGITEPHPLLEMTAAEWDKTLGISIWQAQTRPARVIGPSRQSRLRLVS